MKQSKARILLIIFFPLHFYLTIYYVLQKYFFLQAPKKSISAMTEEFKRLGVISQFTRSRAYTI
jgi:hypothetical protein